MNQRIEKWRIRRELTRLFRRKYSNAHSPEEIDAALAESAPLRTRLAEIESHELIGRAMSCGIIPVDLPPFRFGSPLWQEEAGHRYLSVEAKRAIRQAISAARKQRAKEWLPWIAAATGIIGGLIGLIAVLKH